MFFFHGFSINLLHVKGGYGYGVLRHFQQYFSYIVAVSFINLTKYATLNSSSFSINPRWNQVMNQFMSLMLPSFENRKINIDKSFTKLSKVNKKYVLLDHGL
jgi:hypothetical protein